MKTYIINEKRQAGGNSYKEYTWKEVLDWFHAPSDLVDIEDLKEWYERANEIAFDYDVELWRISPIPHTRELSLREFVNYILENATEEQLDMPLLSIGAGNTGFRHIFVGGISNNTQEEIKVPIYKEEK